ncbi:3'(2'),5'-bisphosphate nucleotidase CysQ [Nesterenkonia haasae]|uniref:3'(2'),5'-bisphosphate nucleotidase CysQ n=1 Tax=Nesterenkonia haasae TaxID=2587813 RepID=UPI00139162F0|nr:3'(2'),5'-bisphosphate nucleotidase CysQ [Nesterenkonia haasae]NDK33192.1 3'(2'),5'-bisphosphate nucleotidase CysQ [Nesterenkonia haasae]
MTTFIDRHTRTQLLNGVYEAGNRVMEIYQKGFDVDFKEDTSPLTAADTAAHYALVELLHELTPEVPVLSEESAHIPWERRRLWSRYWLVDPLDGTKEFIKGNGEFTLNIALVEQGEPVFGVVHAPVLQRTWLGQYGEGSWRFGDNPDAPQEIFIRSLPESNECRWKIVGSRSHGSDEFEAFCAALPEHERISMGSSLKLCLVAEGEADLYPRLAPTSEWDTAAAHAVVTAAGGVVLNARTLQPLRYNQEDSTLNPWFVAAGERSPAWEQPLSFCLTPREPINS